jgi:hypothetical protein
MKPRTEAQRPFNPCVSIRGCAPTQVSSARAKQIRFLERQTGCKGKIELLLEHVNGSYIIGVELAELVVGEDDVAI